MILEYAIIEKEIIDGFVKSRHSVEKRSPDAA